MVKIGVLALQGAIREHIHSIEACEAKAITVKSVEDLALVEGLILPGGESTAMRKLIDRFEMLEPLRQFALDGKPMFGTCAGLILLAKELVGYDYSHVGKLDAIVERNSYGRQVDSFEIDLNIEGVATDFPAVFIRAPQIVSVEENVEILATHGDRIVMVKQGHLLGCSFHPELTDDHRIMTYFIEMVKESLANEVHVK
ncbi:pyridoxal 5'-phosphate synthase glutaminase subunit PdxT [Psychrobacillus antarcticus]|uniref:pyridoxal 5'-phosphate synthase glutaminase subunit PdxT n=1 Tax=Psychrobacillus antarcticus TaxID=2879115 RepID=UPI0024087069|nr:pyridoxal 5'-phosphate synthase glutaminase subunit PdxT [Psychrobacillus antarcticus]